MCACAYVLETCVILWDHDSANISYLGTLESTWLPCSSRGYLPCHLGSENAGPVSSSRASSHLMRLSPQTSHSILCRISILACKVPPWLVYSSMFWEKLHDRKYIHTYLTYLALPHLTLHTYYVSRQPAKHSAGDRGAYLDH